MEKQAVRFVAYDTLCRVELLEWHGKNNAQALLDGACDIAMRVQSTLNMYDDASELSVLCRTYRAGEAVRVSPMLFRFLAQNLEVCRVSGGAFDPTVAPLVKLWDFLAESPRVPETAKLQAALASVGHTHISLDKNNSTVIFDMPGISIDPGASGKGFALGLTAAWLRQNGVERAVLNFGNNLYAIGPKGFDETGVPIPWKTAIRSPENHAGIIGTVPLCNAGVSTSSWYEHCFTKDGEVYHHLLDPRTGRPAQTDVKSMSVVSSSGMFTDVLSTAFYVLGIGKTLTMCDTLRRDTAEMIEYVAVANDGRVVSSPQAGFCKSTL